MWYSSCLKLWFSRECLSGKGEWYHLEHFTDDVIFQDQLFKLEGRDELSAIFVSLNR